MKEKSFIRLLMTATSQESSKRFVVIMSIIVYLVFWILCIFIMAALFFKLLGAPDNTVTLYFALMDKMIDSLVFIIAFGIGASALVSGASLLSTVFGKKADAAMMAAQRGVPGTVVQNQPVETQNVQNQGVQTENVSVQNQPDINELIEKTKPNESSTTE